MAIDPNEAILTWQQRKLEEYVTYHTTSWKGSSDYGAAIAYFDKQYQQARAQIRTKNIEQQINALNTNLNAQSIDTVMSFEDKSFLDNILARVAEGFDTVIQKNYSQTISNFQSIVSGAIAQPGIFINQSSAKTSFQGFVNQIDQALQLMNIHPLDKDIVRALAGNIGSSSTSNVAKMISQQEIEQHRKILTYLDNAVKTINAGGMSKQAFYGLTSNVFNTVIGESLAQYMLANVIKQADKEVIKALTKDIAPNVKVILNDNTRLSGTDTDVTGKTSKADIINSDALTLQVEVNGATMNIVLSTNFSVKWKTGSKTSTTIQNNSPLMEWVGGGPGAYYAYNLLAHRTADEQGFKTLKAGVSASFLNEWIAGSGALMRTGGTNTAQFIMINGRIYSISRIINLIADELEHREEVDGVRPVNIDIDTSKEYNAWRGDSGKPSWKNARERSDLVKESTNKFTITGYLNKYVLSKYINALT